jgi:hypothetical protein
MHSRDRAVLVYPDGISPALANVSSVVRGPINSNNTVIPVVSGKMVPLADGLLYPSFKYHPTGEDFIY